MKLYAVMLIEGISVLSPEWEVLDEPQLVYYISNKCFHHFRLIIHASVLRFVTSKKRKTFYYLNKLNMHIIFSKEESELSTTALIS